MALWPQDDSVQCLQVLFLNELEELLELTKPPEFVQMQELNHHVSLEVFFWGLKGWVVVRISAPATLRV